MSRSRPARPVTRSRTVAHRHVRRGSDPTPVIDALAPDNVGRRAKLATAPPGRTIGVPVATRRCTTASLSKSLSPVAEAAWSQDRRCSGPLWSRQSPSGSLSAIPSASSTSWRCSALSFLARMSSPCGWTRVSASGSRAGTLANPLHPAWAIVPGDLGKRAAQRRRSCWDLADPAYSTKPRTHFCRTREPALTCTFQFTEFRGCDDVVAVDASEVILSRLGNLSGGDCVTPAVEHPVDSAPVRYLSRGRAACHYQLPTACHLQQEGLTLLPHLVPKGPDLDGLGSLTRLELDSD